MELKKVGNIYGNGGMKKVGNIRDFQQAPQPQEQPQKTGAWNWTMNQLIKPVAMASNALEDTGKGIAAAGISAFTPATFRQVASKVGFAPIQHQKDVLSGRNQRTYSDITNEAAKGQDNQLLKFLTRSTGYGGDFLLDPLNKVKLLALTKTGTDALKGGKLALSAAEQAKTGQRALLQLGKYNVLPSVGNKVLEGSTKLNDLARSTPYLGKVFDAGAAVSGKIRPLGVDRKEFKILTDAKTAARDTIGYTSGKAIEFAKGLVKELSSRKTDDASRAMLLHAVEKGDKKLVPKGLEDLFQVGVKFKNTNEKAWKSLGGSVLEGHGLSHVATKEVAEQARKDAFKGEGGFKLTSTKTPQDIHREWVKANGVVTNLKDAGIKFKNGVYSKGKKAVDVTQATAKEINEAIVAKGGKGIFQEDLPIVAAKMGISTGRKQAATDFLEATKGLKSEEAKALANEVHNKMTNPESLRLAIKGFDSIQNIWKAQALVSPSYHIRNIGGNLWNNYLADVQPAAYAQAGYLQQAMKRGTLTKAQAQVVKEMEKHGVINTGQFTGDIAEAIDSQIGKSSKINPFSQKFIGYRANRALGSTIEDNAKIAHFLSKRAEGYGVKQAAESVKKFLFDYGDLTGTEQGLLKRVMPFYTWTSKNIPLQVQQFIENPGKFSKVATAKKDIEQGVPQPNEQFMSDYIRENGPIRTKQDADGTKYFLAGAWLPAVQALQFLSNPKQSAIGMITPTLKLPYETATNQGTFFQNTLGQYDPIKKYPGQKTSYLGVDIDPKIANLLRSIRPLNELDKLNPGGIFGVKNSPSFLKGIIDNASNERGGRYTPEMSQSDRVLSSFVGKLQNYDPKDAKYFYDRDTQQRVSEFDAEIKRASKNKQKELVSKLIEERRAFQQSRSPRKSNSFYTK